MWKYDSEKIVPYAPGCGSATKVLNTSSVTEQPGEHLLNHGVI